MRDYPAFPSVFRVASAFSVNKENVAAVTSAAQSIVSGRVDSSVSEGVANTTNSNMSSSSSVGPSGGSNRQQLEQEKLQQQHQQQQQQQQQYQQNNINYHHQTMNNHHQKHQNSNGVINTISGSIPATGFKTNHYSTSCRNSCTELDGFPVVDSHHHHHSCGSRAIIDHQSREKATKLYEHQRRRQGVKIDQRTNSSGASGGSYLWIVTPVAASISVAIVIAALAGPQWLYTEEKLPNVNYNGTANFNALDDGAFITKYTKSSLWILCTTMQGVETYNCIKIDYFPKEGYQPDPLDSTPAIPYTVTKSCPYFLASGLFLLISFIVFLVPTCSHQNNLFYFSAGIMFIVSGLLMLIGLIAYISILKAEIGSKLRPRSTLQPPLFKVTYGQSFFLFVFGFMATEFVGLLNIFLYISLQEVGYYSRLPCLTITNIQQKIKEGENPRSHTYKCFKHPQITPNLSGQTMDPSQHQVQQEVSQEMLQKLPSFTCKKHPRSNILLTSDLDRRYFFEKPPKCDLHSKNLARSLNELYTEPAPPLVPPPPPFQLNSGTTPHGSQTLPRQTTQFADLPHEFPLTRSISTATELCSSNGSGNAINGSGNATAKDGRIGGNQSSKAAAPTTATTTSRAEQKNRRNQATNTRPNETTVRSDIASVGLESGARQPSHDDAATNNNDNVANITTNDVYDEEPQQRFCGLKRRTKDELFTEFCRKAGVRPRPKNIYYIDKDDDGDEQRESGEQQRPRRNNEAGSGNRTAFMGDQDEDGEGTEENIYFIDDRHHQHAVGNQRRSSMFLEPPAMLRKLNSNLSLHSLYPPEKNYQKSLFDLDRCDSNNADMWQHWHHPQSSFAGAASYGGSQNRLHQLNYNNQLHPSRTLPRSFLKRNCDSQDSLSHVFQRGSANTLNDSYSNSQNRMSAFTLQQQQLQQQQLQQHHEQQHYVSLSRDGNIDHSALALHKSCDDIVNNYHQPAASFATYVSTRPQHLTVPSNNVASQQQQHQTVWPTAIPTSPSNYATKSYIYAPDSSAAAASQQVQVSHLQQLQQQHALVTRSVSSGAAAPPSHKFQRSYAFDQRRASAVHGEAFDLDEIERERRRSHASLFSGGGGGVGINAEQHYDMMINGTAV